MSYREIAAPGLACLWTRVVDGEPGSPVLPDACSDMIWQSGRGAFVAGPDTGPAPAGDGAVYAGARFGQAAGGAALGLPLEELRDRRVDLADLRRELAERLPGDLEPREAARRVAAIARELVEAGPADRAKPGHETKLVRYERVPPVFRHHHLVVLDFQPPPHQIARTRFIVDNENPSLGFSHGSLA